MSDWKLWFSKLKWQLISFKFLAFWTVIFMMIGCWRSLGALQERSVVVATELFKKGYITKDHVATIITHSQTVLYDSALSHLLIFCGAILASIITLKGVSYWQEGKTKAAVIQKMNGDATKEDLKQFLPRQGQ